MTHTFPGAMPPPAPADPLPDPESIDESASDGGSGGGILSLLEQLGSVVVPIGVGLYAIIYIGIRTLYNVFGINPEQAGIDQGVLLGRLMLTLVMVLLLVFPLIGVVVTAGWLVDRITGGRAGRAAGRFRRNPWAIAILLAVVCAGIYFLLMPTLEAFLGEESAGVAGQLVLAGALGLAAFMVPLRLLRRTSAGRAASKIICGALAGITIGFALTGAIADEAIRVAETADASPLLNTFGFQDQWVIAEKDDKPMNDGMPLLLLGEAEGAYALYDCTVGETFRIPMESVELREMALSPGLEYFGEDFACGAIGTA